RPRRNGADARRAHRLPSRTGAREAPLRIPGARHRAGQPPSLTHPMWGIIPAAGAGSRIQPLACSKELLPVGRRLDGSVERPKAVSEFLVERMILGGA